MESTNHNLWTLTKNVAVSINKGAGKLDVKIYGGKTNATPVAKAEVPPPAPKEPEKPVNPNAPSASGLVFVLIVLALGMVIFGRKKLQNIFGR